MIPFCVLEMVLLWCIEHNIITYKKYKEMRCSKILLFVLALDNAVNQHTKNFLNGNVKTLFGRSSVMSVFKGFPFSRRFMSLEHIETHGEKLYSLLESPSDSQTIAYLTKNPEAFQHLPSKKISYKICKFAVSKWGQALLHVPAAYLTPELENIAIDSIEHAIAYVRNPTFYMVLRIRERYPDLLERILSNVRDENVAHKILKHCNLEHTQNCLLRIKNKSIVRQIHPYHGL